jgi:hypothetical protein
MANVKTEIPSVKSILELRGFAWQEVALRCKLYIAFPLGVDL